jgi:hypothetical protein
MDCFGKGYGWSLKKEKEHRTLKKILAARQGWIISLTFLRVSTFANAMSLSVRCSMDLIRQSYDLIIYLKLTKSDHSSTV